MSFSFDTLCFGLFLTWSYGGICGLNAWTSTCPYDLCSVLPHILDDFLVCWYKIKFCQWEFKIQKCHYFTNWGSIPSSSRGAQCSFSLFLWSLKDYNFTWQNLCQSVNYFVQQKEIKFRNFSIPWLAPSMFNGNQCASNSGFHHFIRIYLDYSFHRLQHLEHIQIVSTKALGHNQKLNFSTFKHLEVSSFSTLEYLLFYLFKLVFLFIDPWS